MMHRYSFYFTCLEMFKIIGELRHDLVAKIAISSIEPEISGPGEEHASVVKDQDLRPKEECIRQDFGDQWMKFVEE